MTSESDDRMGVEIQRVAAHLDYPPTPQLKTRVVPAFAPSVMMRRLAVWIVICLVAVGVFVPQVRAAFSMIFRIGVVSITLDGQTPDGQAILLDAIAGETDLQTAAQTVTYPVLSSPTEPPNRVFVQEYSLVISVWVRDGRVVRALYHIPKPDWAILKSAEIVAQTSLGDNVAFWVDARHPVQIRYQQGTVVADMNFVAGSVLIWEAEGITYRLETVDGLEAAQAFALSLRPVLSEAR